MVPRSSASSTSLMHIIEFELRKEMNRKLPFKPAMATISS
jgi:hypothetical protein